MAVRMGVSKDTLKAPEAFDEDLYEIRLEGFKPAFSKNKTSINYNPQLKIVSGDKTGTTNAGKKIPFESLNATAGWILQDFTHAFGEVMTELKDGTMAIPGAWEGDPQKPETLRYVPDQNGKSLLGKTFKAYVVKKPNQKNPNSFFNVIKAYVCAVPNCNTTYPDITHSTDLT